MNVIGSHSEIKIEWMKYSSIIRGGRNLKRERRTRLEIYFDVLIAIKRGRSGADQITKVTDIPPSDLDAILDTLKTLEFIEDVKSLDWSGGEVSVHYRFTARGESLMRYLSYHDEILSGRELREFYL